MVEKLEGHTTRNKLFEQIRLSRQARFTGKLDIVAHQGLKWSLYFNLGSLIWVSGGTHSNRRWHRIISHNFSQISFEEFRWRPTDSFECWDYHVVAVLVKRHIIEWECMIKVLEEITQEILFDIFQYLEVYSIYQLASHKHKQEGELPQLSFMQGFTEKIHIVYWPSVRPSEDAILPPARVLPLDSIILRVEDLWQAWLKAGLKFFSPNLVPVVQDSSSLRKQTSASTYKKLLKLVNGKRTLREIAWIIKKDILQLTSWLLPFVQKKSMKLILIKDWNTPSLNTIYLGLNLPSPINKTEHKPLIACIDDSPQTCFMMKEFVEKSGCRFLAIQNEVEALSTLLKHKPSLIFLDLVMPIANGYEICAQIRRMSAFKETPIVILTAQDSVVDRFRAKMVGANGFLGKPIEESQIQKSITTYLHFKDTSKTEEQSKAIYQPNIEEQMPFTGKFIIG